jgi:hypothetical protein
MNRECGENCIVESKKFHPANCPMFTENFHLQADWREVTEPVTESNQLPKLTTEIFDRPDCPEWAKWAAVDKYEKAMWYECEPKALGGVFRNSKRGQIKEIPGEWDASDWQNSIIERPAKETKLPDWCKVGEWVYSTIYKEYTQITDSDEFEISLKDGAYCSVGVDAFIEDYLPARLRPYNAEEMKALVGKVIENKNFAHFITTFDKELQEVVSGSDGYSAKDLVEFGYTIDGPPCGKLEHLEDGEWVE